MQPPTPFPLSPGAASAGAIDRPAAMATPPAMIFSRCFKCPSNETWVRRRFRLLLPVGPNGRPHGRQICAPPTTAVVVAENLGVAPLVAYGPVRPIAGRPRTTERDAGGLV